MFYLAHEWMLSCEDSYQRWSDGPYAMVAESVNWCTPSIHVCPGEKYDFYKSGGCYISASPSAGGADAVEGWETFVLSWVATETRFTVYVPQSDLKGAGWSGSDTHIKISDGNGYDTLVPLFLPSLPSFLIYLLTLTQSCPYPPIPSCQFQWRRHYCRRQKPAILRHYQQHPRLR